MSWGRISCPKSQKQLQEIKTRPVPAQPQVVDYIGGRDFLKGLSNHWHAYSPSLRNRLLRHIIAHVEIRGHYDIEATIIWKNGFRQKVMIYRSPPTSKLDRSWTEEADKRLKLYCQNKMKHELDYSEGPCQGLESIPLT